MSVRFTGFDVRELFSHALLWGAASLVEDAGVPDVRIAWSGHGKSPVAELAGDGVDAAWLGGLVRDHAQARDGADGWIGQPFPHEPKRGLFSPRVKAMGSDGSIWSTYESARRDALDRLSGSTRDLRMIGAIGEAAWWVRRPDGSIDQDAGASRLEMQPRNQGSEFIGSRLRPLTRIVARRSEQQIAEALTGSAVRDEMGGGASDSRTATNLRPLRPTDDAAGYVALWGLACSTVVQTSATARTATSVLGRPAAFAVPVWTGSWTAARLRAVLASDALAVAGAAVRDGRLEDCSAVVLRWLREHGVRGLIRTPVTVTGSTSAPERRAVTGTTVPLPGV